MATEVVLPKVDMDMEDGVIAAWKVAEGDRVEAGDILFEMETAKSIMEVEAPASGVIRDLAPVDGAIVAVGTVVAWIDDGVTQPRPATTRPADDVRATPFARRTARETGVDLAQVKGSGPQGRIVAADVTALAPAPTRSAPRAAPQADARLQPFTVARRMAARRLAESVRAAPHFYLTAHVEMGALRAALSQASRDIQHAVGHPPTLTVALAFIAARTLVRHPLVNASVEGDAARLHEHADIGIAMERGGDLVVPVLRAAETKDLATLAADYARLRDGVRAHTLPPSELAGGTHEARAHRGVRDITRDRHNPRSARSAPGQ